MKRTNSTTRVKSCKNQLNSLSTQTLGQGTNAKILSAYPYGAPEDIFALKRMVSTNDNVKHEVEALLACQELEGVCDLEGIYETEDYTYLAMPHYDKSLFDVVTDEGPLEPEDVRKVMVETLSTLEGCHEAGVAHLDVKPENIMLDDAGKSVLIDFGSSHQFDEAEVEDAMSSVWLETRAPTGTEEYAAPELASDQFCPIASDVYSTCATAVSLLTAEFPEQGVQSDLMDQIQEDDPELHEVIMQGLSEDPALRPSPSEALEMLGEEPSSK